MDQKETSKRKFRFVNLTRNSIRFLIAMLLTLGVMYFTLPFELTVAGAIVFGIIAAYESLRALILWVYALMLSSYRRFVTGIRRAIHVAKMPDEEFEMCFSGKHDDKAIQSGEIESETGAEAVNEPNSKEDKVDSDKLKFADKLEDSNYSSLIPAHARVYPLTPVQAAMKAVGWWTETGLDGYNGKERLSILTERLRDEVPNEKAYNLVEYGKELFLPKDFCVLQAIAQLLSEHGYEADADEDTSSLYIMRDDKIAEADMNTKNQDTLEQENNSKDEKAVIVDKEDTNITERESNEMQLVLVKPGKASEIITVSDCALNLEKLIGAASSIIHPLEDQAALIYGAASESGSSLLNRYVATDKGDKLMITGDFLIVGMKGENFASLTKEMTEKYMDKFMNVPVFIKNADHSYSVCYPAGTAVAI